VVAAASARVIAVTGASRGIGAAIAFELARRGYTVACLTRKGRGPETGDAKRYAKSFVNVACDVTDGASVQAAFAKVVKQAGALHGLVNNAGIHLDAPSRELATPVYEQVMATNATAVFAACREVYPHLVKSGGGIIVNIGSFFDKVGVKRNVAYCASKAAVGAITRCLAVEWASKGIRVLDVAPGYIVTDLNRDAMTKGPLADYLRKRIPSGVMGTTADVAKLVAAIIGEDLPFLTGETIYIDGAQGIAN
jgi:NAD(P)-dependent dehydrogenase (short-subunit alcohol dehydrogenase family)